MDAKRIIIVTAADSNYFDFLVGLLDSLRDDPYARDLAVGVLYVGLTPTEAATIAGRGIELIEAGWDVDFPGREQMPGYYRAMSARPYIPNYFPGHDIYVWLDSDAWVQDGSVLRWFIRGAERGKIACVPELDRGYWTVYKRPKLWTQNHKAFAWSFGLRAGDRYGRNPIVGTGILAMKGDAPHWRLWAEAHKRALNRKRRDKPSVSNFYTFLSEQTALNYMIFADKQPATFLPAYTHWVCGKGELMFDPESNTLVEPHEPHATIGIAHPGGQAMKERVWEIATVDGGTVHTWLTYREFQEFLAGRKAESQ